MIRIVTDSGAHLPFEVRKQLDIVTVPLVVMFGAKSFLDEVELTNDQFYEMLRHEKVHPTTSAPPPAAFIEAWKPILDLGDEIVTLTLPRILSATYASALAAKSQLEGEHKSLPISIVDSQFVSMAEGFQAIVGARAACAGQTREQVAAAMKAVESRMTLVFLLDTLEYLRRGGRIGNAQAFLGTMFSVKPLLQITEGRVEPLERVRSRKAGFNRLVELVGAPPPPVGSKFGSTGPLHLSVLHAGAPKDAEYLENEVRARYNLAEFHLANIGPVIATHSGPQAVGLAFYRE